MEINERIKILKAMADTSRLVILNALMEKPQYVEELAERLDLAASTVSFHLKKLEEANLVYKVKEQYYVIFHINMDIFNSRLKEIVMLEKFTLVLHEERILKYKEKILRTFIKRNKLIKIPVQYKKRLIILEEICKNFMINRQYNEKEVDEILERYYEDYTSLRRYLIDYKFLSRNSDKYQLWNGTLDISSEIFIDQMAVKTAKQKKTITNINTEEAKMSNLNPETKRELKRAYKEAETPVGIYQIKNLKNGKIFIGVAKNLNAMINRRKAELKMNTPFALIKTGELQNDWNKYGEENFSFEILDKLKIKEDEPIDPDKELKILLELWLEKLQPFAEKGYNEKK